MELASLRDETLLQSFYNASTSPGSDLELFFACFRQQSCDSCLASEWPCSWCMTSQVCVPNNRTQYPFQILAPIKYEDICPLKWRERWEMRAKPFSCRCSTMTLISVVVAVLSTIAAILLLELFVIFIRWLIRRCCLRSTSRSTRALSGAHTDAERRPLLRDSQD